MTNVILPTLIFNEGISIEQQVTRIKEYGADGIEVRRERLKDIATELERFKHSIQASGLDSVVYSVPIELWQDADSLNPLAITAIKEAELLNADYIKFSLGRFDAAHADVGAFYDWLQTSLPANMKLSVENDQTTYGGMLRPILSFFQWKKETPVSLTFDVGNWTVNDEDWQTAYDSLHQWIEYLHLKTVTKSPAGWESKAISTEHLDVSLPAYAAIEFPLEDPDTEGPEWINKLRKEVML